MKSHKDYRTAVSLCVDSVMNDSRCRSVMLYGSIARDEVRPGRSDVLDAVVVLDDAALQSLLLYKRLLTKLTLACQSISSLGLPFHPFHYYRRTEILTAHPALFLPTWKLEGFSKVAAGEDLRIAIQTTSASIVVARTEWYSFRRYLLSLAALCIRPTLRAFERKIIIDAMVKSQKKLPLLVCLACDRWVEQSESHHELERMFPTFDLTPLQFFCPSELQQFNDRDVQESFMKLLDCVEELDCAVIGTGVYEDFFNVPSHW
jgi:hypothetical protein